MPSRSIPLAPGFIHRIGQIALPSREMVAVLVLLDLIRKHLNFGKQILTTVMLRLALAVRFSPQTI